MAYRFSAPGSIQSQVQRIVIDQLEQVIAEIDDTELDRRVAVHQARKRCKKIRALLRLVRPGIGNVYARENSAFRDAARRLSGMRDAAVMIETLEALGRDTPGGSDDLASAHDTLEEWRRESGARHGDLEERLAEFRDFAEGSQERVSQWSFAAESFAAIERGLRRTYARGRDAMDCADAEPTPDNLHDWRKRAKDHWCHCRLLRDTWKPLLQPRIAALRELSVLLGNDHDLVVLRGAVIEERHRCGGDERVSALLGRIERRRIVLQTAARPLGIRIYAEKPGALARRIGSYWHAWEQEVAMPSESELR